MPLEPVAVPCCPDTTEDQTQDPAFTQAWPEEAWPKEARPKEAWPEEPRHQELEAELNGQGWFVALAAQVRARDGCWQGALLDLIMGDPKEAPEPADSPPAATIEPLQHGVHQGSPARPVSPRSRRGRRGHRSGSR